MALAAATVLEVRVSGSDVAGGGFVTGQAGVDFSQQNSKNVTQQGTGTTLSGNGGSITSGATTLKVASITNLYSSPQTTLVGDWIKIDSEIMKVTAQNLGTLTLTVTRAQLTTVGASHNDGATVTNISNVSTTDIVTAGTTTLTSATAYWSANAVGSIIYTAGGTGSLTGSWHQIISVSTSATLTTCVVDSSTNLGAGTGATMNIGGALATYGQASALMTVGGMKTWIATGTYTLGSSSANVAGGTALTSTNIGVTFEGYGVTRGDLISPPTLINAAFTAITMFSCTNGGVQWINLIVDGNGQTGVIGINGNSGNNECMAYLVTCQNCPGNGFTSGSQLRFWCEECTATVCAVGFNVVTSTNCKSSSNTSHGFGGGTASFGRAYLNTGNGFNNVSLMQSCTSYKNTGTGFTSGPASIGVACHAETNTGAGYAGTATAGFISLWIRCSEYNNAVDTGNNRFNPAVIVLGSTAFVNAAGNDFSLNNVTTGGAKLRGVGAAVGFADIGAVQSRIPFNVTHLHGGLNG